MNYDILVVGAGFSGCVIANKIALETKKTVLVIDNRNHIGGNCYDYYNKHGILMPKYGAHLFHTQKKHLWEYIKNYGGGWEPWEHRVLARIPTTPEKSLTELYAPIPICIGTIAKIWDASVSTPETMEQWIQYETNIYKNIDIQNSEQSALKRVGKRVYDTLFKDYTMKQWGKSATELDASVLERIPLRLNHDDRYFTDPIQVLPRKGYHQIFNDLLHHPQITTLLETDFIQEKHCFNTIQNLIYTGPIDHYYANSGYDRLEYRSIHFQEIDIPLEKETDYVLPASVVNEPSMEVPYTRTVEPKRFLYQKGWVSTIVREFSTDKGEPYYPVPNPANKALYEKYRSFTVQDTETKKERKNIHFLGRLANYKYMNMDEAIGNALDQWEIIKHTF